MPTLDLPGTQLYYEVTGAGVPVLLIHGMGLDARMWDDQVAALADVAQLARMDLRGFGRSPRESAVGYSHAADVWALADHLGWDDAVVVGLSMGGVVALETALAAPDRTRSLALLGSALDGVPLDAGMKATLATIYGLGPDGDVDTAKRVWLNSALFAPAHRDPAVAARLAAMTADYPALDWRGDDPHDARPKLFPLLPSITVPTTVIVGELEVPSFGEMSEALASRIPGARKVVVPDAGHMVNMEQPKVVNDVLRKVIAGVA